MSVFSISSFSNHYITTHCRLEKHKLIYSKCFHVSSDAQKRQFKNISSLRRFSILWMQAKFIPKLFLKMYWNFQKSYMCNILFSYLSPSGCLAWPFNPYCKWINIVLDSSSILSGTQYKYGELYVGNKD